ncbi:hypothetical protein [Rhodoferax sp.]|uniref:hypothetical protein n=1 Tax=Rhodoferax sp. TaxID=50421 RepID=UPI003BB57424
MNWLARLKKIGTAPTAEATEATKPGFVGFVAPGLAPMQKTGADSLAANDPVPDPDRWAWPHSQAMTGREIDTFTARLARFTDKGLSLDAADALAEKLVTRDREPDDRRLCLECVHLAGHAGVWGCRSWQRAGVATKPQHAQLSAALVNQPQRCDDFTDNVKARYAVELNEKINAANLPVSPAPARPGED